MFLVTFLEDCYFLKSYTSHVLPFEVFQNNGAGRTPSSPACAMLYLAMGEASGSIVFWLAEIDFGTRG